ncbi:MAG: type II toxin-antitoxin system HicB family antitoxin [Desulfobacterales bacterium]
MKYKIVLTKTDEGYSVSCPGLPGCWSQGKTEAEAIENIIDAINEYLAAIYDSFLSFLGLLANHATIYSECTGG